MNLGNQGAGGVNDFKGPRFGFVADSRGHAVGAKNKHRAGRNLLNGFDEDSAAPAQLLDNVGVMNDFMVHIDGRPVGFQRDRKSTRLNSSHVSISYAVF